MEYNAFQTLEQSFGEDLELTRTWITDLASKIKERNDLSRKCIRRLRNDLSQLESAYEKIYIWAPGYNIAIDRRRTDLRNQTLLVKGHIKNEEIDRWRDTAPMERELRMLVQAYTRAKWRKEFIED